MLLVTLCYVLLYPQKKKAISRRKDISDNLATYCYQMRVSTIIMYSTIAFKMELSSVTRDCCYHRPPLGCIAATWH